MVTGSHFSVFILELRAMVIALLMENSGMLNFETVQRGDPLFLKWKEVHLRYSSLLYFKPYFADGLEISFNLKVSREIHWYKIYTSQKTSKAAFSYHMFLQVKCSGSLFFHLNNILVKSVPSSITPHPTSPPSKGQWTGLGISFTQWLISKLHNLNNLK